MDNPPLQTSLQQGIEDVHVRHFHLTRLSGALLVVLIFLGGMIGAFAYLNPTAGGVPVFAHAQESAPRPARVIFPAVSIQAKSAIVYDIVGTRALYEKNADVQLPLASLTKIPLALAINEVLPPYTELIIPRTIPPTSTLTELKKGSRWRSQDLIDLTLAASSNDGAEILASAADDALRVRYPEAPAGGAAVYRMNALVQGLGLTHTYFMNPTGLDETTDQSGAYGTARDMAVLFAHAATSDADLFAATARPLLTLSSAQGDAATAHNTDHALSDISGIIMGKTGYTDLAGGNLAVVYSPARGVEIAVVVLGSTEQGRFDDVRALVQAANTAIGIASTTTQ